MTKHTPKSPAVRLWTIVKQHKKAIGIVGGSLAGVIVIGSVAYLSLVPIEPKYQAENQRVDQPIVIDIPQPARAVDLAQATMSPHVDGEWSRQPAGFMAQRLVFTPKHDLKTATKYTIALPKLQRVIAGEVAEKTIDIVSEKAPGLTQKGMLFDTKDVVLPADGAISISLTSKNRGLRDIVLRTQPEIQAEMQAQDDQTFRWKPKDMWPQGQALAIEIYDTKNNESLLKKTINVAAEPQISSPPEVGDVAPGDAIKVTFNEPIDATSGDKIAFGVQGEGKWNDDKTYEFHPTGLQPGARYDYTIKKGMRSQQGGIIAADKTLSFSTIGSVAVVATSPRGAGLKQDQQVVSVTFNRPVDKASAQARLRVSSGEVIGTSWSGNTMHATVRNLGFQRHVTVTMLAGVQNTSFGLPTNQNYSFAFDTEVRTVRLNVPHYAQQQAATCTAASLRMMLAYRGVQTDEMSLVRGMGYAPREADRSTNPPTWDDPDQMFVGFTDGNSIWRGAGPDAPPVAKAARAYRGAANFTGVSAEWIAARIHEGNPVMMFGATRNSGFVTWQTQTGRTVRMNISSHVTVVTGVVGEPYAPIGFWVNDPLRGVSYWTAGQVRANIARDAYAQAVVVY